MFIGSSGYRGLTGVALLLLALNAASAQATVEEIEEIQVTATRRPAPESEVSAALTIISAERLRRGPLITDALAAEPGLFLQQTTPGQGAAIIRGLKGSEVLHLVDGMRLNNAIFRNAPTQYLALVAPGGVERIEVVRGAPASLYGSDAVGGVVQVLSRVPAFDEAGSRADAYFAFDTADQARILRGSWETGDRQWAALVSGEYLEIGSRRTGQGERLAVDGYRSKGGRVAFALTPDEGESWLFDLQVARQPNTPRVDELLPGYGQDEPSSSEFYFAPNDRVFAHVRHSREQWLGGADWVFDLGWQRIVDDRINRDYLADTRRYENNSSDLFGLTANASNEFERGAWVAGFEVYHDRVASRRTEEDILTGLRQDITARFPDGSTVDQAAVFANLVRHLGDRHSVSGGLRFSAVSTDLPATGAIDASRSSQDDLSADLGWIFSLTGNAEITANLGYGFRAPNVFDLGTLGDRPGNRFNIPNPDLSSEHITQFDLGFRWRGERMKLSVVGFVLQYTDRIASVSTGELTDDGRDITQSQNVDEADIHGIESAFSWRWTQDLTVDLVVNYLRGEQSELDGTTVAGDRIPPLNGRVVLGYQASDRLRLDSYLLFADRQDRLSPRDAQDTRIDPNGTPGWVTANVAAEWQFDERWLISARLENLLDKHYRSHGSGIDAAGRNIFVSLQAAWQ